MEHFHITVNHFSRQVTSFFEEELSHFGLAVSYVELLLVIRSKGSGTQKMIAEALGLAPSTITRFVDKLVAKGLVSKEKEGRESIVTLTRNGVEASAEMEKVYEAAAKRLRERLGEKYFDTTGKLLNYGIEALHNED